MRLKGAEPAMSGTITGIENGYASVRYDHRPGIVTRGDYPLTHLEAVTPAPSLAKEAKEATEAKAEQATKPKPRASSKDVLPPSPAGEKAP